LSHLTIYLFLCICLRLLMSLTFASHSAIGASNRTYFICKALISFSHQSIIALLRAFFHYSLSLYPLYFHCLKGNNSLSLDKRLFLLQRYLSPFRSNTFCFEQECFISWKETLFPRNRTITIDVKAILLYRKYVLLSSKCLLLHIKSFLLHAETFLLRTNYILLAWKTFLLPMECLLLKTYIWCLKQTVFCLSYKYLGQKIFYIGSRKIHYIRSQKDFI